MKLKILLVINVKSVIKNLILNQIILLILIKKIHVKLKILLVINVKNVIKNLIKNQIMLLILIKKFRAMEFF